MADERAIRDLGPLLASWMDAAAPERPPERLLEEAFARTMTARQAPVYPWHRVRRVRDRVTDGSGLGGRFGGLALAGIGVALVIALAAGFFPHLDRGVSGPPSPTMVASPSPSPSLPSPSPSPSRTPTPTPTPTARPDPFPSPIAVVAEGAVPVTAPIGMTSDGSSIWLFTQAGDVVRIDPLTNTVVATAQPNGQNPNFQLLAGNAAGLWLTDWTANKLYRLDPKTLGTVATIVSAGLSKGILVTDSAVWIANTRGGSVERIDPARNTVTATIPVGPIGLSGPNWLGRGFGSIWVGIPNASIVARIGETTNIVTATIPVTSPASPCGPVAATTTAIWITSCDGGDFLAQIDPLTNKVVATIDMGGRGNAIAVINDHVWISPSGGQIVRIDPVNHVVDRVLSPGPGFAGGGDIVVAGGSVWISDYALNRVLRLPLAAFGG